MFQVLQAIKDGNKRKAVELFLNEEKRQRTSAVIESNSEPGNLASSSTKEYEIIDLVDSDDEIDLVSIFCI